MWIEEDFAGLFGFEEIAEQERDGMRVEATIPEGDFADELVDAVDGVDGGVWREAVGQFGFIGEKIELEVANGGGLEDDEARSGVFFTADARSIVLLDLLEGEGMVATLVEFEDTGIGEPAAHELVVGEIVAQEAEGEVGITGEDGHSWLKKIAGINEGSQGGFWS